MVMIPKILLAAQIETCWCYLKDLFTVSIPYLYINIFIIQVISAIILQVRSKNVSNICSSKFEETRPEQAVTL